MEFKEFSNNFIFYYLSHIFIICHMQNNINDVTEQIFQPGAHWLVAGTHLVS